MDRIGRWLNETPSHAAFVYFALGTLFGMATYALLAH